MGPLTTRSTEQIAAYRALLSLESALEHDWLVKLDADTLLHVPPLRALLRRLDPSKPLALAAARDAARVDERSTPLLGAVIPLSRAGAARWWTHGGHG